MRIVSCILLSLCLAVSVRADGPKILAAPVPQQQPSDATPLSSNKFIWLWVDGYEGDVTWDGLEGVKCLGFKAAKPGTEFIGIKEGTVTPDAHVSPASKSEVLVIWGKSPGKVTISAWGSKDNKAVKLATKVVIVDGGDEPPPIPPGPKPQPIPEPTGKPAWLIVVEETSARTAETVEVLSDLDFWNALCTKGHNWRFYDKDAKDLAAKGYYTSSDTLPVFLILDKDGNLIHKQSLPVGSKGKAEISKVVVEKTGVK